MGENQGIDFYTGGESFAQFDGGYQSYSETFGYAGDMNFVEYADENFGTESAPEPASLVLIATGLVGVGAVVRRRRA